MHNPFVQDAKPWVMTLVSDAETVAALELILEDLASSTARTVHSTRAHFMAVFDEEQRAEVERRMARYAKHAGVTLAPKIAALEDTDWAAQAARDFPPMRIGRFYVHGSHVKAEVPVGTIPLVIDASAAFGTGEHETTEGCLLALELLHRQRRFAKPLDMGCGTAILGIGAYALWRRKVLAVDNDPVAVKVARAQVRQNRMRGKVRCEVGNGYRHRSVQVGAPYDLIVANILARPLMKMARSANRYLQKDGVLVLSGLLREQEPMVLSAHRYQGLYLRKAVRRGNWSALVLSRRMVR